MFLQCVFMHFHLSGLQMDDILKKKIPNHLNPLKGSSQCVFAALVWLSSGKAVVNECHRCTEWSPLSYFLQVASARGKTSSEWCIFDQYAEYMNYILAILHSSSPYCTKLAQKKTLLGNFCWKTTETLCSFSLFTDLYVSLHPQVINWSNIWRRFLTLDRLY